MKLGGSIKTQSGFTMLEIMMAMGLSVLVVAAVYTFYINSMSGIKNINEEIEASTEIEAGQRIVLRDMKNVDPSYAALTLQDDEGRPFFDYFPDVSERELAKHGSTKRTITMKWSNGLKEIVFLMHDPTAHELPSLVYDPGTAFKQTEAGEVTFLGVNVIDQISSQRPEVEGPNSTVLYPGYWVNHQQLMFDTPISFREQGSSDIAKSVPRPPFFVGKVDTSATPAAAFTPVSLDFGLPGGAKMEISHPIWRSMPEHRITSVQKFLELLPAAGGGQPLVRVRPVRLVRYFLVQQYPAAKDQEDPKKKNVVKLMRQMMHKGQWTANQKTFIVTEGIKSVQFVRRSITEKAITFDISRVELKKGGEI